MLRLRSEVFPDFFQKRINYSNKLMLIGSCFAENIGQKLNEIKIPIILNPFGVLYNPESVWQSLVAIMERKYFEEDDLEQFNEKWISFSHHGIFSGTEKTKTLEAINRSIENAHLFLKNTSILFITFGTAWVYLLKSKNKIVANCHKIPSQEFEHFMLTVVEITESYQLLLNQLHQFNPDLQVVFTVSPVRHWKNGPVNNHASKSVLTVAVHELIAKNKFATYFPSYEIMIDDLRDYRFYGNDLFHPNHLAVEYIWEKFYHTYLTTEAIETANKLEKLRKNLEHKVFYPKTIAYKNFIASNLKLIDELKKQYPSLSFENEQNHFLKEGHSYFPDYFNDV